MRVAIIGAAGRMGKVLIEAVDGTEGLELGAAVVEPGSSLIGADAGEMTGIGKTGVKMAGSLADVKDDFGRDEVARGGASGSGRLRIFAPELTRVSGSDAETWGGASGSG